jgi:hypothetical protein
LSACVTIPCDASAYSRAPPAQGGKAHLYFFRQGAFPTKRVPAVLVDGKLIFEPPEGAYTVVALSAGTHVVKRLTGHGTLCSPDWSFR